LANPLGIEEGVGPGHFPATLIEHAPGRSAGGKRWSPSRVSVRAPSGPKCWGRGMLCRNPRKICPWEVRLTRVLERAPLNLRYQARTAPDPLIRQLSATP
jgi:hypothetical protein